MLGLGATTDCYTALKTHSTDSVVTVQSIKISASVTVQSYQHTMEILLILHAKTFLYDAGMY
jgi:hypothetical protein